MPSCVQSITTPEGFVIHPPAGERPATISVPFTMDELLELREAGELLSNPMFDRLCDAVDDLLEYR